MQLHSHLNDTRGGCSVWLYSVVFAGKLSVTAVMLLILSFAVQPFHQAMANEAVVEEEEPALALPAEVEEQLPDVDLKNEAESTKPEATKTGEITNVSQSESTEAPTDISNDTQADSDGNASAADNDTTNLTDETQTAPVTQDTTTTPKPRASSSDTARATTSDIQDEAGIDTDTSTSSDDSSGDVASTTDDVINDTERASSTDTTGNDGADPGSGATPDDTNETDQSNTEEPVTDADDQVTADDTTASNNGGTDRDQSSSDDLIDSEAIQAGVTGLVDEVVNDMVNLTRQLVTEENYYQFSKQSCVAVGDGTYHCTTKDTVDIDPDSAIYAELDADGDKEIYLRTSKGDIKQLTDNTYDDSSPDVDLASMRAVWQRMIDGRYQIISYDLETRVETQLTFSRTNSMEPKVAKEGIVWQAWDGNDWEIMFFDGQFTDQITNNDIQDVTPVIEDGYVLWSLLGGEESQARVYSIESGEIMTITGGDGGTVANPRFVLVYDTKFDNGDVVTVGFDPVTGLAKPVSSQPAELPYDIPEPDPVGEIRALIQNKSTGKSSDVVTVQADDDGALNLASTSATSSDTLDLHQQPDMDAAVVPPADIVPEFELEDGDLVITREASSTTSSFNDHFHHETASGTATSTQE